MGNTVKDVDITSHIIFKGIERRGGIKEDILIVEKIAEVKGLKESLTCIGQTVTLMNQGNVDALNCVKAETEAKII